MQHLIAKMSSSIEFEISIKCYRDTMSVANLPSVLVDKQIKHTGTSKLYQFTMYLVLVAVTS